MLLIAQRIGGRRTPGGAAAAVGFAVRDLGRSRQLRRQIAGEGSKRAFRLRQPDRLASLVVEVDCILNVWQHGRMTQALLGVRQFLPE